MNRVLATLILAVVGYAAGAVLGGALVGSLSTNRHDRALEAAMTGAFVTGPLGALAGAAFGLLRRRRPTRGRDADGAPHAQDDRDAFDARDAR